jgi:hypothetical protein
MMELEAIIMRGLQREVWRDATKSKKDVVGHFKVIILTLGDQDCYTVAKMNSVHHEITWN